MSPNVASSSASASSLLAAEPIGVAPASPDAPGVPFPRLADDAFDPVLAEIESPRRQALARTTLLARLIAIAAAGALAFALRHDIRYALSPSTPLALSSTSSSGEVAAAAHRYVSLQGVPGGVGAVEYRRPLRDGLFRLAPLVDRPDVYVELQIPAGVDPMRFVPPTSIQGRLSPLDEGGARFSHARTLIESATGAKLPAVVYLLEPGAAPSLQSPGAMVASIALLVGAVQLVMLLSAAASSRRQPAIR